MSNLNDSIQEVNPEIDMLMTTNYKTEDFNITKALAFLDEDLNFKHVRLNFRRFLGPKKEHRCLYELINKEDIPAIKDNIQNINEKPIRVITDIERVDGQSRRVMLQLAPARVNDKGYAYECLLFDLLNLDEYTTTLELQTLKYKNILENFDSTYFEYNSKTEQFSLLSLDSMSEILLCSTSLNDIYARLDKMPEKDKTNYSLLCQSLEKGDSCFEYAFEVNPFKHSEHDKDVIITGRSITIDESYFLVLGQISSYSEQHGATYSSNVKNMDMMTGLLNKKAVLNFAKSAINERRYKQVFLMMLDLDNFKLVNDNYGHAAGDAVIRNVADILKRTIGNRGCVGRFGGDEYFAVLHDIGSEGDIRNILGAIMYNIETAYKNKFDGFNITASIGISEYPRNGDNFELLFRKADRGVYIAKNKGKKRYIIYKEQMHGEIDLNNSNSDYLAVLNKQKLAGDLKRYQVIRDGMLKLFAEGKSAADDFMQQLIDAYMLTGISLYLGCDFTLYKQWGNYSRPMDSADYMLDKNGIERFNSKNIFWENNVGSNDNYVPVIHDKLQEHNIFATAQCMIGSPEDLKGLVTFDLEKPLRNWTEEDLSFFGILAQFLGQLYI